MKLRLFLPIFGLLVLGAVVFWWAHRPPVLRSALELLPADTIFVIEARHGTEFINKLRDTRLVALWREPEVQRMIGAQRGSWAAQAKTVVAPIFSRLDIGPAFVAILSAPTAPNQMPIFAASAEMGRNGSELNHQLAELSSAFSPALSISPLASRQHLKHAIFPAKWRDSTFEISKIGNRCFAASNPAALDALLDRWARKKSSPALQNSDPIRQAAKWLPATWESRVVLQSARLTGSPWFQKMPPAAHSLAAILPPVIVGQNHIVDLDFHDTIYLAPSPLADWPELGLAPTLSPDNFFEIRLPLEALGPLTNTSSHDARLSKISTEIKSWLETSGVSLAEWQQAFGPEMRVAVRWPDQAIRPAVQVTSRIRNPAAAAGLFARLEERLRQTGAKASEAPGGQHYLLLSSAADSLYAPALTLEKDRLRLVSNLTDLPLFREETGAVPIQNTLALQRSAAENQNPILSLQFDSAQLADRGYRTLRPLLIMSAQFLPRNKNSLNWNDLPRVETLQRHLGVTDLQVRHAGRGLLLESNGPITVWQWLGLGFFGPAWLLQNGDF